MKLSDFFPKNKNNKGRYFINENKRKSLSGEDFTVVSRTRNAENAVEDRREVCPVENVSLIEARADVHETSLHLSPRPCWTNTTRSPWPSRKTVWSHLVNMNVTSLVASREERARNGGDFMEMAQTFFHTRRNNDLESHRFPLYSIVRESRTEVLEAEVGSLGEIEDQNILYARWWRFYSL